MKSLIIDTSTKTLYLALVVGSNKKEVFVDGQNDHTRNIIIKIQELLVNDPIDTIDEIIVGIGPGSYTGVRIGITVAKMLAWTKKITLKSISSLYLLSSGYKGIRGMMIDARRGNVFGGIYEDNLCVFPDCHISEEEFLKKKCGKIYSSDDYCIDAFAVIANAQVVDNVHTLVPNYLRETEAERELKND